MIGDMLYIRYQDQDYGNISGVLYYVRLGVGGGYIF